MKADYVLHNNYYEELNNNIFSTKKIIYRDKSFIYQKDFSVNVNALYIVATS